MLSVWQVQLTSGGDIAWALQRGVCCPPLEVGCQINNGTEVSAVLVVKVSHDDLVQYAVHNWRMKLAVARPCAIRNTMLQASSHTIKTRANGHWLPRHT